MGRCRGEGVSGGGEKDRREVSEEKEAVGEVGRK